MEASLASLLLRQFISGVVVGEKLTQVEILETISDSETWVHSPTPTPTCLCLFKLWSLCTGVIWSKWPSRTEGGGGRIIYGQYLEWRGCVCRRGHPQPTQGPFVPWSRWIYQRSADRYTSHSATLKCLWVTFMPCRSSLLRPTHHPPVPQRLPRQGPSFRA